MQAPELLQELVVVFGVAVMVVLALSRLRLPTIAGLIAAGALIGPSGLGWVPDSWRLEALAEIGVGLLLFGSSWIPIGCRRRGGSHRTCPSW